MDLHVSVELITACVFSAVPRSGLLSYPLVVLLWELLTQAGRIEVNLWGLPLMIWGIAYAVSIAARAKAVRRTKGAPANLIHPNSHTKP